VVPTPAAGSLECHLEGFLNALMAEQLIRPTVTQSRPAAQSSPAAPLCAMAGGGLRFERFTDMQDLLTLDPIHEVTRSRLAEARRLMNGLIRASEGRGRSPRHRLPRRALAQFESAAGKAISSASPTALGREHRATPPRPRWRI